MRITKLRATIATAAVAAGIGLAGVGAFGSGASAASPQCVVHPRAADGLATDSTAAWPNGRILVDHVANIVNVQLLTSELSTGGCARDAGTFLAWKVYDANGTYLDTIYFDGASETPGEFWEHAFVIDRFDTLGVFKLKPILNPAPPNNRIRAGQEASMVGVSVQAKLREKASLVADRNGAAVTLAFHGRTYSQLGDHYINARSGRKVAFQRLNWDGTWTTIHWGTTNAAGRASFVVSDWHWGAYRAVMLATGTEWGATDTASA